MTVGIKETIEVRITRDEMKKIEAAAMAKLATGLGKGVPTIKPIRLEDRMKVSLHGGEDFDIKSVTDEEQYLKQEGFNQWIYDVIPLKSGNKRLRLLVVQRVLKDGKEERIPLNPLERTIVVKVNIPYTVGKVWEKNWQWVIGTLLVPFIVWVFLKTPPGQDLLELIGLHVQSTKQENND